MDNILFGKHILLFVQSFFGYEKKIGAKFKELGASIDLYDERPITKGYQKAIIKFIPNFYSHKSTKYYDKILSKHKEDKYDYVLFVDCDMVSSETIKKYRTAFPKSKFCLYLWDSIKNLPDALEKSKLFDFVSSFDRKDCLEYGFHFRPLFYLDNYITKERNTDFDNDLVFVGTGHSDRYGFLKDIKNKYSDNYRIKFDIYLQGTMVYYYYKLTKKSFRKAHKNDFYFTKKSAEEIFESINKGKVIVDIQHEAQSGLTMRTLETLGLKKKMITTNQDIVNYDFYNSNNILVVDRDNPVIDEKFMEVEYQEISNDIYEKYSLESWVKNVLQIGL